MIYQIRNIICFLVLSTIFFSNEIKCQLYGYVGISPHDKGESYSIGTFCDFKIDSTFPSLRLGLGLQRYKTIFTGVHDLYLQVPLSVKILKGKSSSIFGGFQFSQIVNPGETKKVRLRNNSFGILLGGEAKIQNFTISGIVNFGNSKYYRSYVDTWYFDRYYRNHRIDQFTMAIAYRLFD